MFFTPDQQPVGSRLIRGEKTILFSKGVLYRHGDTAVNLFCRPTILGNLRVHQAEKVSFKNGVHDVEIMSTKEAVKEFGHKAALNPETGVAGELI